MGARSSLPKPGDDPFVGIMFAIPRLLVRRSSCDESLQLHSVAYLAAATAYCCNRTKAGVPGWLDTVAGEDERLWWLASYGFAYVHRFLCCWKYFSIPAHLAYFLCRDV